ncbi:MAG: TolC family protein [Desulfitobacteriaceae bacterium]
MKRVAGVLLISLAFMPLYPAYASESTPVEQVVLQEINQLRYEDIEKIIMERNPTVKTNIELIDSASNGYLAIHDSKSNLSDNYGYYRQQIKQLKASEEGKTEEQIAAIEQQIASLQASIAGINNSMEKLENTEEDTAQSVEMAKLQVEMGNQQIISGAQSLFFNSDALMLQQKGYENTLSYLNKKYEVVKLQKSLGLVSDLDESNFAQQIKDLNDALDQNKQNQDTICGQVNLMIGQDFNHPLELVSNAAVDEATINALDYQKDLASVMEKNYNIILLQMSIEAKELALDHSEEMDGLDSYAYKAAQEDLNIAVLSLDEGKRKLKQGFELAYKDVFDKLKTIKLEQSRLDNLKTKLNNAQLSNELGLISDLELRGVTVEYDGQVLKVQNAQEDVMKAYTTYQWMVKGISVSL